MWKGVFWYLALAILITVSVCYGVLTFKVYFYGKKIDEINSSIATYSTPEQKANEKEVFDYKKKIEDYTVLISSHKISSNVLNFIEQSTLENVWFSSFSMAGATTEIRLSGEAESMEVLSQQFKVFENSKKYVKHINVLNSYVGSAGRINFILNITLDSNIFTYT